MKLSKKLLLVTIASASIITLTVEQASACTRVVYKGDDGTVITGRTLDWRTPIGTNLYVMPRGITRTGYDTPDAMSWTSRYGSVVSVGYDAGVNEGMNEKGLVCNLLFLPGTVYARPGGDTRPYMSTAVWVQYVLDNFGTTREAVETLKTDFFQINAPTMPDGTSPTLHMAISDATGYSAVIEYDNGVIDIHEGHDVDVVTNAPPYEQQCAINSYWEGVGGMNMLPGTNRSSDRFARASFYIHAIPRTADRRQAIAGVFGVLYNCSVPSGITVPGQPEISSTQWRAISDQTNLMYFFQAVQMPSIIWIDLKEFDLSAGAPVMKLDLINTPDKMYMGDVIGDMKPSQGYTPMYRVPDNPLD